MMLELSTFCGWSLKRMKTATTWVDVCFDVLVISKVLLYVILTVKNLQKLQAKN
jgi:hypothetical protein